MKVLNVELKMTIPNALSIFRLLLLPVFATLYLMSEKRPELLYWSFGVLVLSGVTIRWTVSSPAISTRFPIWAKCWTRWRIRSPR